MDIVKDDGDDYGDGDDRVFSFVVLTVVHDICLFEVCSVALFLLLLLVLVLLLLYFHLLHSHSLTLYLLNWWDEISCCSFFSSDA